MMCGGEKKDEVPIGVIETRKWCEIGDVIYVVLIEDLRRSVGRC